MTEQQIFARLSKAGFIDQGKRGRDKDERFRHRKHGSGELRAAGSIYAMSDRITATGSYKRLFEARAPKSNGKCNSKRYPAWSGAALRDLLRWIDKSM